MFSDPGIFEYCNLCTVRTRHVKGRCLICKAKDDKEMEAALERIRIAEGATEPDLFQGDMFDAGEASLEND